MFETFKVGLSLVLLSLSVHGIENKFGTVGYARLQTSFNDEKSDICFKAPGAGSKYRLGNECETWIETGLYQEIKLDNGITIHNQFRPVFSNANNKSIEYLQTDELYTEVSGIFANSVSFWAGRRFYKRYDSHMNDYFFLNMSGDGVGMNDLNLGGVSLSYSYLFDRLHPQSLSGDEKVLMQSHDVRVSKPTETGEITFFLNYMNLEEKTFDSGATLRGTDGYAVGLLYRDGHVVADWLGMRGENMTGLFYGRGLARGAGAYSPFRQEGLVDTLLNRSETIDHSQTWRFINYNGFENDEWGIMSNFVYESTDDTEFKNVHQEWVSFGIRPYWFFHHNSRIVIEAGYDRVHDKLSGTTYGLGKVTSALEFALDKGIWKRPVVRLYYTQADWTESAKGLVGTDYYRDTTSGNNLGIQIEYWW